MQGSRNYDVVSFVFRFRKGIQQIGLPMTKTNKMKLKVELASRTLSPHLEQKMNKLPCIIAKGLVGVLQRNGKSFTNNRTPSRIKKRYSQPYSWARENFIKNIITPHFLSWCLSQSFITCFKNAKHLKEKNIFFKRIQWATFSMRTYLPEFIVKKNKEQRCRSYLMSSPHDSINHYFGERSVVVQKDQEGQHIDQLETIIFQH